MKKMRAVSMRVTDVESIGQYDVIIIGSPMRFGGFTKNIRKFIERHESELFRKKVVYFLSILYIVKIAEEESPETTPYVDPTLAIKTISRKSEQFGRGLDTFWTHFALRYKLVFKNREAGKQTIIDDFTVAFFGGVLDMISTFNFQHWNNVPYFFYEVHSTSEQFRHLMPELTR